jgi:sugar phosphate isomerase/epimerase
MMISRREFAGGAAAVAMAGRSAWATPLGLPLGIQLYSVREQMAVDLDDALAAVSAAEFVEVEAAALPKRSAKEVRAALDKAGLRCVSSHRSMVELTATFDETVAYDKELGVQWLVCPSPGARRGGAAATSPSGAFALDDIYFTAEQLDGIGEKLAGVGVRLAYHNHWHEFVVSEGKVPYFELLERTDPKKVSFEMDCGWVVVGGRKPVEIMANYPRRFTMLHVKDFKVPEGASGVLTDPKVTELGMGSIDYGPVFAQAARNQRVEHVFAEQEAFDMPWKESLKVDAAYMRRFRG